MNYSATDAVVSAVPEDTCGHRMRWWQVASLALLMGLLYYQILLRLAQNWWNDDNYSHGFFVPVFSAFVVWQSQKKLSATPVAPSWFGLGLIAAALMVLIVGELGAELFLIRSSFVLLLAGLIVFFWGWDRFRVLLFPWAFLFLMIPIPVIVFNHITFPLQLFASQLASWLLALVGVPVLREGNVIRLPTMTLEVVDACSGIRSLVSLEMMALIYAYFLEPRILGRVVLALAAVPIAIVANGLRVMGAGVLGHFSGPRQAFGFFHTFSGGVIFLLSLAMLVLVHGALRRVSRWGGGRFGSAT